MTGKPDEPNVVSSTIRNFLTKLGIVGELFQFLAARRLWWLVPLIVLLILVAVAIAMGVVAGSSPFIYTLF